MTAPLCSIDRGIFNEDTISGMKDIGLSFFAGACGKNRGAWVLDPPDGQTYSCLTFPKNFAELAGSSTTDVPITDANAINKYYLSGNLTAADTINMLDYFVQGVYLSSPDLAKSPFACEFDGLAGLTCGHRETPLANREPIRAVGLEGLFTSAPWATGGKELSLSEAQTFYTAGDFLEMKDLGLNTVQISVPTAVFMEGGEGRHALLREILSYVKEAALKAIIVLVSTGDEPEALVTAATFCYDHPSSVLGLVLPEHSSIPFSDMIVAARGVAPKMPLFIPGDGSVVTTLAAQDKNVYGAVHMTHSSSVADIASSSSEEDRSKLFYHEAVACMARSPLEFLECYGDMPTYVFSGFDLSIDDCVLQDTPAFKDYGQCDRWEETVGSGWWKRHRKSYAARQLFAYERGMGWTFATWKLYDTDSSLGEIDAPEQLLALKNVVAAGLFPSLDGEIPAQAACLNPPDNDFGMGDATLAPTPSPPPDCGYGWWNYTTLKCDYWIPPPVPPDPTPSPTAACPVCEDCSSSSGTPALLAVSSSGSGYTPVQAGAVGAVLAAVITTILFKTVLKPKRDGYDTIPN